MPNSSRLELAGEPIGATHFRHSEMILPFVPRFKSPHSAEKPAELMDRWSVARLRRESYVHFSYMTMIRLEGDLGQLLAY